MAVGVSGDGQAKSMAILDPRAGDAEDDASSTKSRSLTAIAGSLLAEISLFKLALAWTVMVLVPGVLFGLSPLIATAWVHSLSGRLVAFAGVWPLLVLAALLVLAWFLARPLFRLAESSFWSMNSIAVQPAYALCREGLRHLAATLGLSGGSLAARQRVGAATAALAGVIAGVFGLAIVTAIWPFTRWNGTALDLIQPHLLLVPALANTLAALGGYFALASLTWGIADAMMDQPRDLVPTEPSSDAGRRWRVAHLSDVHVVGERYGFRIESGRAGPRGNERFAAVLARLADIHRAEPLDVLLISGDMTDAGRPAEWAEFLDALVRHPELAALTLVLPGNHDLNIVDRANPARLDLPWSPIKRLRQVRALSAIAAVQGGRVHVVDRETGLPGRTLDAALEGERERIARFADAPTLRDQAGLSAVWADIFPMLLPPAATGGLGVIILNSNAESHFSFTNALGLISAEDLIAVRKVIEAHPKSRFLIALHHHLVEYPRPAKALSERIGTALINGSAVVRGLKRHARRLVAMHGHRHVDWIGACGELAIVSAPSPVMEATNDRPTSFLIHTLVAVGEDGIALAPPERIVMPGEMASGA